MLNQSCKKLQKKKGIGKEIPCTMFGLTFRHCIQSKAWSWWVEGPSEPGGLGVIAPPDFGRYRSKTLFFIGQPEGLNYYLTPHPTTPRNSNLPTALRGRRMLLKDRFSPMCLPSSDLFLTPSQHPPFLSAIDKMVYFSMNLFTYFILVPQKKNRDLWGLGEKWLEIL